MKKILILLTLAVTVTIAACTKPADKPAATDNRDALVGAYNIVDTVYLSWSGASPSLPGARDTTITSTFSATWSKNGTNANRIDIVETSGASYFANAITANGTDRYFNVPQYTVINGTDSFVFAGAEGYMIGSQKYDGTYSSSKNQLTYIYTGSFRTTINGIHYSVPLFGTETGKK